MRRAERKPAEASVGPHTELKTTVEDNAQASVLGSGLQYVDNSSSFHYHAPGAGRRSSSLLLPLPAKPPDGFVGRTAQLQAAIPFVSAGRVIPVVGQEHTGRSAFIERLMSDPAFSRSLPRERSWNVMNIRLPGAGSRIPVLRVLAAQLEVDLDALEDDGSDASSLERKARDKLHERLIGMSSDCDLVTVIDCTRFADDVTDLESDLDDILSNPAFQRSVVLIASTTDLVADGGQQLRRAPAIRLGPLEHGEAVELLSAELVKRNVSTDADEAIRQANDDIAKRPKIVLIGIDEYFCENYDGRPRDEDPERIALALLEACRLTITTAFAKAGYRLLGGSGEPDTLALFFVWSLTEQMPLPPGVLEQAGLRKDDLEGLVDQGVLVEDGHLRLSVATQVALRNLLLAASGGAKKERLRAPERTALGSAGSDPALLDSALAHMAHELFDSALRHWAVDEGDHAQEAILFAVECGVGWLKNHVPGHLPKLFRTLAWFANSLDVNSIGLPVDSTGVALSNEEPESGAHLLYQVVSELNVKMREPVTAASSSEFLAVGRKAAAALAEAAPLVPTQMLRSIDSALFLGGRHFRCQAEVLSIRTGVGDVLREDAVREARDQVSRLVGAISWLLNIVVAQLDEQQMDEAEDTAQVAHDLLDRLPQPNTPAGTAVWLSLHMRAAKAAARLAANEDERLDALASVVDLAEQGLERCAPSEPLRQLWTKKFLDAAKEHALELREDQDRVRRVEFVLDVLVVHHGSVAQWNLPLRIAVAKFERVVHREQADPELLLDGAKAVLALLVPMEGLLMAQALAGHPTGLLELALAKAFDATALFQNDRPREALEEAKAAVRFAEEAVARAPGTDTYHVWLKCLDVQTQCEVTPAGDNSTATKRRQAIAQVKAWLEGQTSRSESHARLAFRCLEDEWYQAGRSLLAAAQKATDPYDETPEDRLKRIYLKRNRVLKSHEGRYGPTVEALLARADLERQYRQLLVTTAKGRSAAAERSVDNSATWSTLDRATELWPYSDRVRLARAGVFRILWQYQEAVEQFETVIRASRSGYRRRIAQIAAAEVLLTSVRYGEPVDGDREAALRRAAGHLTEPLGHHHKPDRVLVLRERIALEAGETVNWSKMDTTFEELFHGDFPVSISTYLNLRRQLDAGEQDAGPDEGTGEPSDLSQLLYDDFTDVELVTGLGHLYLRQSELLGTSATDAGPGSRRQLAIQAAERAYDCFDAGRVVLEARYDSESAPNSFNRAQAIRVAATLERTVDPFPLCPSREKSWLHLALRLYESVRARSVGAFHALCHERYCETQELLRRLTPS